MKVFLLFLSLLTLDALAKETKSFKEIEKETLRLGNKYGVSKVLVVLDIDNTILTMPRQFGSDQWFTWQSKNCLGDKYKSSYCVAKNFGELLGAQGQIFAMSQMVPTEKLTVNIIKNLQQKGFKLILLTSRGSEFRNSTYKELERYGLSFNDSAIGPYQGFAGKYKPYKLNNLNQYGLVQKDVLRSRLKKPRWVSYQNGVYMTAGQNKGIMLRNLLAKTNTDFKAIVFADDHHKHIKRMRAAFEDISGVELSLFRYGGVDHLVEKFKKEPVRYSKSGKKVFSVFKSDFNRSL